MNSTLSDGAPFSGLNQEGPRQKRSRVLLSCGPCRYSKLKCDRGTPCSQCQKKGRDDLCKYAPKLEKKKKKPAKTMAARLKRLEGMVRGMMDEEGNIIPQPDASDQPPLIDGLRQPMGGQVVRGKHQATTWVGPTHCLAMLEDIEDLKAYFDEGDKDEEMDALSDEVEAAELVLLSPSPPRNREDIIAELPEKRIADRLITRYYACMSPSQHIIHRPSFSRTYARFWQDNGSVNLHWISQLFMMLALGVHFNRFQAPQEVEGDSPLPPNDRIKHYKSMAREALSLGKYTQPNPWTIPAFMLYTESFFLLNRAGQMQCSILSSVCIRLMLKVGLHRDPSKLANITPFEGEMRRRMWNMGIQVETLVSFHMGLPSVVQSVETDTQVPRNLKDEDFDEDCTELPPERPSTDWTITTYPINKTKIMRVFGNIVQQSHALTPSPYSEVLRLDQMLQETWKNLPTFMMNRPLDECVGDPPVLIIQRFGLAALYNKSRCVLHRKYLVEDGPLQEHDYSRQQCLRGAMTLLENQEKIWEASKPGNVLAHHGWFLSSLAVHDYLLAAVIVYMILKDEQYGDPSNERHWSNQLAETPSRDELKRMLVQSHTAWTDVAETATDLRKTADTLAIMLSKLGVQLSDRQLQPSPLAAPTAASGSLISSGMGGFSSSSNDLTATGYLSSVGFDGHFTTTQVEDSFALQQSTKAMQNMSFPEMGPSTLPSTNTFDFDSSWVEPETMDWRFLDISLAHGHTAGAEVDGVGIQWTENFLMDDSNIDWGRTENCS
ncbi:putative transcriptional regulatory protein-like protein [Emericellopsis cladophorae]|uniref:Transcriptional regulatory protein-like protein n=1 Tax=Emericellopsis cladophorae TaxID=2686198 RepID=A0A9P9Y428_9HYPO|nr:putative transcriptional regulatory protein-like protein [Emericellopsis cladophorae]KAI6782986.1 putative transcriptional regulatory protein-like protein [Emericellopsis cladophorae]